MKRLLTACCLLALTTTRLAAADFTQTMTVEEQEQTGLGKLSPGELARLKAVVERYKSGEVAVVQMKAEEKVATAEAKVKAAEDRSPAPVETPAAKKPSWFAALVTLQKTAEKPDKAEVLEARLAGNLKTFNGRRSFELQDGQLWRMIETARYSGPTLESPVVTISPGIFGVYWLQIREAALRVKVEPVKLR